MPETKKEDLTVLLQQITALCDVPEPTFLKRLIDSLRVRHAHKKKNQEQANANIQLLIDTLKEHPDYGIGLAAFTLKLLKQYRQTSLYVDTGILSDQNFGNSFVKLMVHRVLPQLPEEDSIVELVDYLFDTHHDEVWLASIDNERWDTLIELIHVDNEHQDLVAMAKNNVLNAMVILSYRISGIGLHPDLMAAYPQMLDYSAAFVAQNEETVLFVDQYRKLHELDTLKDVMPSSPEEDVDPAPLLVMIEQCEEIVHTIRKRIYKTGISIRLTNMMLRLEQSLERLRILSELVSDNHKNRDKAVIELTRAIIMSAKRRYSIGYLINNNTRLLSQKMTENASRVGEHYISTDKTGYKKMFKKAAIGGFVIAFMATLKILSYGMEFAPIGRAFINSMIYGLGFVFIHLIHGTVATKQPAMTAAAIASTISDSAGKQAHKLAKLSELMIDIFRTQFIAILGNVLIAMPLALLISYAWLAYFGTPMIEFKKADVLLYDLNPFESLALFHAAIAGVFLFVSGLIAGYYDNLAVFNHIGERIARHRLLLIVLSKNTAARLGTFIEANLGAIMGNFLFGVFLGSTGTLGYILGLPLDIRHIAFASANFAHGIFNTSAQNITIAIVGVSLLGVALIGMINLAVSFSLALMVALRSKGVRFLQWRDLAKLLANHMLTHPKDFFLPRPTPMQYASINAQGQMVFDEGKTDKNKSSFNKKYVMRRLSDEKVVPAGTQIDTKKVETFQEAVNTIQATGLETDAHVGSAAKPSAIDSSTVQKKHKVLDDSSYLDKPHKDFQLNIQQPGTASVHIKQNNATDSQQTDTQSMCHESAKLDNHASQPNALQKPKKKPQLPD